MYLESIMPNEISHSLKVRYKRFHLYEVWTGTFLEIGLMVARGWMEGSVESNRRWAWGSSWGDETFWN
jgi:hypothetical protein